MLKQEQNTEKYHSLIRDVPGGQLHDEHQLWQQFKNGDRSSFSRIYNTYIYSLYSYGDKIARDKTLVEDCIHDLFVELWQQKESLGGTSSIKFYLFKGLKRKIVKALQKENKQSGHDSDAGTYAFSVDFSHELHLVTQQLDEERKAHLARALQKLSKREKEVIYLRFYDGLSYQEIASLMAISVKTAYNSVHNAICHLRRSMVSKLNILPTLFGLLLTASICYYFIS